MATMKQFMHRALLLFLLVFTAGTAWGADIVIYYNGYFLAYDGTTVSTTNTFNPETCIWNYDTRKISPSSNASLYLTYANNSNGSSLSLTNTFSGTNYGNNMLYWTYSDNGLLYLCYKGGRNTTTYYFYFNNLSNSNPTLVRATTAPNSTNVKGFALSHRAEVASESAVYSNASISISPTSATLDLNGNQNFSTTASATKTTTRTVTTVERYRFNNGSNIDYYKQTDGTYGITNPGTGSTTKEETVSEATSYAWTAGSNLTLSSNNKKSTTATYSVGAYPASTNTVSVTATFGTVTASASATVSLNAVLVPPTITISATGSVTITHPVSGVSIRYTTDGSEPTATSKLYSTPFTVTNMNTVKAAAFTSDATPVVSAVASQQYKIPSGVSSDGVVTLNDYEDHNWAYYKGNESGIQSLDPRNVKITYEGRSSQKSTWNSVNNVGVSFANGERDVHTFVYYKTLEKTDLYYTARNYHYETIANPFSRRPASHEGFYGWKLVSISDGVSIVNAGGTAYAVGSTIPAETIVYFNFGTTTPAANATAAEVELEAVWGNASIYTGNNIGTGFSNISNTGTYETNFIVLSGKVDGIDDNSYTKNVTITSTHPSSGATNNVSITGNIILHSDYKFEHVNLNAGTITANGHKLVLGRGLGTGATTIRGINGNVTNVNNYVRVESGTYTNLYCYDYGTTRTMSGTTNRFYSIWGCDFDRAKGDNSKLRISTRMYTGQSTNFSNNGQLNSECVRVTIKSGSFGNHTPTAGDNGGTADDCFYMGVSTSSNCYTGLRTLIMEGGILSGIAGGMDPQNNINGNSVNLRIKGGEISHVVYGAAAFAGARGNRRFVFTGGKFGGWIAGGSNGTDPSGLSGDDYGIMNGNSYIYIGGTARVESNLTSTVNLAQRGDVFGSGNGGQVRTAVPNSGKINTSHIVIADNAFVKNDVYGGGQIGFSDTGANIWILGGTVGGRVFGGSISNRGNVVNIKMTDGTVVGGFYGGSNITGTIDTNTNIQILGGIVGTPGSQSANICGGGYGSSTNVTQKVDVSIGDATSHTGPTIYGDVYGGSQMGKTNTSATTAALRNTYSTTVAMNGGRVYGDIYGGGYGENGNAADVNGNVTVNVTGGTVWGVNDEEHGGVYGGNNLNGTPRGTITVNVSGSDAAPADESRLAAIRNVFGGGNKAAYTGNPAVNISGGHSHYVFGGAQEANITGNTHVSVTGGKANNIFGGNYKAGTISGTITVDINWTDTNWRNNTANKDFVGNVYGGGYLAAYTGSPKVNFINGRSQKVNDDILGSVYGGGYGEAREKNPTDRDKAVIVGNPTVTIGDWESNHKVTIDGSVFGGGALAAVEGNPTVTINDCQTYIGESVYGGGDAAPVYSTNLTIWGGTIKGNVFGGGNGAVAANNKLGAQIGYTRDDATSAGTGNSSTHIYGGTFGRWSGTPSTCLSGTGGIFGGSNTNGNIRGDINIVIDSKAHDDDADPCDFKAMEAYGAGNQAQFYGSGLNCTIGCVDGISQIFGGAKATDIGTEENPINIQLNISNGTFDKVFGGNNLSGTIHGSIEVNIHETGCRPIVIKEGLYGGGYLAPYEGSPVVNVYSCSYIDKVFGGGLGKPAVVTGNPKVNIFQVPGSYAPGTLDANGKYVSVLPDVNGVYAANTGKLGYIGQVYGGGDLAKVVGSTEVNIATESTLKVNQDATTGKWTATHPTDGTTVGANIFGNVYGGGNEADVTGKTTVNVGKEVVR